MTRVQIKTLANNTYRGELIADANYYVVIRVPRGDGYSDELEFPRTSIEHIKREK